MEWQPIETAPKDGSWFVTASFRDDDFEFEVCRYDPYYTAKYVELENGNYQKELVLLMEFTSNNFHRATHWMPLPPPPQDNGGSQG